MPALSRFDTASVVKVQTRVVGSTNRILQDRQYSVKSIEHTGHNTGNITQSKRFARQSQEFWTYSPFIKHFLIGNVCWFDAPASIQTPGYCSRMQVWKAWQSPSQRGSSGIWWFSPGTSSGMWSRLIQVLAWNSCRVKEVKEVDRPALFLWTIYLPIY